VPTEDNETPYFAGDILLKCDQAKALLDQIDPAKSRKKRRRQIRSVISNNWPTQTISYAFDSTIGSDTEIVNAVKQALAMWTKDTCLVFEEIGNQQDEPPSDFLVFTSIGGLAQELNLF